MLRSFLIARLVSTRHVVKKSVQSCHALEEQRKSRGWENSN